ncbi:cytidylyltransferase domain-containing protein [Propionibacteriaceae bacterium G1746]|uniref:acylneuraminate cytidylyltransferase family protein n=1 Tax=Aestuariimicrobium sp. G57 TaxID=3418485 RepID=UPI003C13E908
MSAVAIIPARGGSKGIPRKNLQLLHGKPLIVWTIEQALAVPDLQVVVSTEDDEIAAVAAAAGAHVVRRPDDLAQDTTATEPVIVHALDVLTAEQGTEPDVTMLLQATSPVRRPGTLQRALDEFIAGGFDSLVGVVPTPPFLWGLDQDGAAVPYWDWQHRRRRQDMSPSDLRYRETGSVYVTRSGLYRELGNRMGGRIGLFVMDEDEGIDIDTLFDLQTATAVMARLG